MPSIGIVIPSYKEAESIASLLLAIQEELPGCQIAVVDDSPNTETMDAIGRLNLSHVTAIHRDKKGGRGSAVLEGVAVLLKQGCDRIVEMDADFSHHPKELKDLIQTSTRLGSGLLIASRYLPESEIVNWPLTRRLFSRASNWLARTVLGIPVHDYTNGFRCYSLAAAQHIVKTCGRFGKGFISLSEILVHLYFSGFRIDETPTRFVNRVRGESSVNFNEIKNALTGLFKIYGLKRSLAKESPSGILEKGRR